MPTGTHLRNAPELLFEAAERVLARDGISNLTSRAVASEAGVAKGVLHRHFADFDTFLAGLILDRAARLEAVSSELLARAGRGTVIGNLTKALNAVFSPLAVAVPALMVTRDRLRHRLREAGAGRFPLIAQGKAMVTAYLAREQALGRVAAGADLDMLSHTLIGSVHLLLTGSDDGPPGTGALRKVVAGVVGGVAAGV